MSIKIYIQGGLTAVTRGKRLFELDGKTVDECLNKLVILVPKLKEYLFFEIGEDLALRSYIEVRVNKKAVSEVLAKEVKTGDEIYIKMNIN